MITSVVYLEFDVSPDNVVLSLIVFSFGASWAGLVSLFQQETIRKEIVP